MQVGVHFDIAAAPDLAVLRGLLRDALRHYTSRDRYLAGLVDRAARFGLDGEASGTVSNAQAARAEASATLVDGDD